MKQIIFNFACSFICSPVLFIIYKILSDEEARCAIGGIWVGFCIACLINGFICFAKEE